jgi:PD-(D/E)XK nuclease superfamily protein
MASELIERTLYAGMLPTVHNPNARGSQPRYTVMVDNVLTKPKGVTTILGAVLAKDFVGWALDCMAEVLMEKVPVVTLEDIEFAKLASTRKRDSGAGTGTEAHALVEDFLKGRQPSLAKASQEAKNAYQAFVKWFEQVKPEVINVEEVIYSQEFKFAGTYDCMLKIDGKVYLCDLKTTNSSRKAPNGVYAEYFIQLGAYALAHDEQREFEEANGGTELLPIDGLMVISAKKNGKLDIVTESDVSLTLDDCKTMFKRVVNLFTFLNFTTKELGGK